MPGWAEIKEIIDRLKDRTPVLLTRVVRMLLVVMPGAPSSFLFLVARMLFWF